MTTPASSLWPLRWRLHRIRGGWRCKVGIHRLKAYNDLGSGNVGPVKPHRAPKSYGCHRVCSWCGAVWKPEWAESAFWRWRRV